MRLCTHLAAGTVRRARVSTRPSSIHRTFATAIAGDAATRALLQQKEYWRAMYRKGDDVFTLDDVNENLVRHFAALRQRMAAAGSGSPTAGSTPPRVLVPLCGRDISLAWLVRQGVGAIGVDFVDEPIRKLGNEVGGLVPLVDDWPRMGAYQGALDRMRNLILVHGDFFQLEEADCGGRFEGAWDRAALTAIESHRRHEYVAKLYRLLDEGGALLLEALCCNLPLHGAMQAEEVTAVLEQGGFDVQVLANTDVRGSYPSFSPPGLVYLREMVVLALKKGPPVTDIGSSSPSSSGGTGGAGTGESKGAGQAAGGKMQ